MNDIQKELMSFVRRISQKKSVESTIRDLRLGFFFEEELPLGEEKIGILAHRFKQEKKNEIYLKELEKIYELCTDEKPLVFKGIAHAYSFYENPNIRFFNDLDLFARKDDCEKITAILEKLGYKKRLSNNENNKFLFYSGDLYADYALKTHDHIDNYVRNHEDFKKTVDGIEVKIELHSYMFSPIRYPFINYNEIYSRKQKMAICDDKAIYTLSKLDTLICASCHLCKHLVEAIIAPNKMRNHIDMKSIIDLKMLIQQNNISWVDVVEIADKWNVTSTLLLAMKLVNYVFPNTVSEALLDRFQNISVNINEKHSHEALIRGISLLKSEDIFFFNLNEFFKKETIDKTAPCYIVSTSQINSTKFEFKELGEEFLLQPYWNEEYFKLHLHYKGLNINVILALTIGSHISYLCAQTFFVDINENNIKLSSSYTNEELEEFNKNSLSKIKFVKQGDDIIFKIPWTNLNIIPHINYVLPFNLKIISFDETKHIKCIKSLTKQNYYDDYGTHCICLRK